ncbi:hypothetical protein [Runella zeae]|uniref:hypothetical protein n=1 Tax=Runella zeae TaxID=94255 RepID=UPI0023578108|nr:hypothetical protein [Runella zeae]
MIRITKGHEPAEWTAYRETPGAVYNAIPELREALLKEQGYLCAYCMRRIPVKDPDNNETSRIDHIQSRENYEERQLDYTNMVICCPGFINSSEHCDKSKNKQEISFTAFDIHVQNSISYSTKDGTVQSSNDGWNTEINKVLCLNNSLLKINRSQVLKGIRAILEKKKWKRAELEKQLQHWSNPNADGKRSPYCGIVIWYLEKKLRQL